RSLGRPMVMEPEGPHFFTRVAKSPKGIDASVAIGVMVVLEESSLEEVTRKTIAFRCCMTVVQVDRDLRCAKARRRTGQAILESHQRRVSIPVNWSLGRVLAVESPDVARQQIRVELMLRRPGLHAVINRRQEFVPALMIRAGRFAAGYISRLGWGGIQDFWYRRIWNRQHVHKRRRRRTGRRRSWSAQHRFRHRVLGEDGRL